MASRAVSTLDSLTIHDDEEHAHHHSHEGDVAAVGARATLRTFLFLKLRAAAFKAFKPDKMGTLDEFRASAARHKTTLVSRISTVVKTEGFGGVGRRTVPAIIGNYLTSGVLFGAYSALCPFPLSVDATLHTHYVPKTEEPRHKDADFTNAILAPAKAGAIAGALHGGIATIWRISAERYYRLEGEKNVQLQRKIFQVPLRNLISKVAYRNKILGRILMDGCSFSIFFASFEAGKQLFLGPLRGWFEDKAWATRKELWTISSTALAAGGFSGVAFTLVRFPLKWTLETTTSRGRPILSTLFLRMLAGQLYRSVLPNAGTFLVMELVCHQLES